MVLNIHKKPYFMDIAVKDIKVDKSVQMRASLNRSAIVDYADNYENGKKMPPVVIYWIPGATPKYLADGFHRVLAKRSLIIRGVKGHTTIRAQIRTGTKRDAMLYAAGCNITHGVRRTNEDKARSVLAFLGDSQWKEWSDTTIARHCGVSSGMVGKYRKWLGERAESRTSINGAPQRTFVNAKGEERAVSVVERSTPLDRQLNRELCPYCGQKLSGKMKGRRHGLVDRHARSGS